MTSGGGGATASKRSSSGLPCTRRMTTNSTRPQASQAGGRMRPARCVPRSSTQSAHDIASPSSASTGMSLLPKRTVPPMRTTRGSDGSRTRSATTDANTSMNASRMPKE